MLFRSAQRNYAVCCIKGIGVPTNPKEGFVWLKKSADQDNVDSLFLVGICYAQGIGVEPNEEEASKCIKKAADQGHEAANQIIQQLEQ